MEQGQCACLGALRHGCLNPCWFPSEWSVFLLGRWVIVSLMGSTLGTSWLKRGWRSIKAAILTLIQGKRFFFSGIYKTGSFIFTSRSHCGERVRRSDKVTQKCSCEIGWRWTWFEADLALTRLGGCSWAAAIFAPSLWRQRPGWLLQRCHFCFLSVWTWKLLQVSQFQRSWRGYDLVCSTLSRKGREFMTRWLTTTIKINYTELEKILGSL